MSIFLFFNIRRVEIRIIIVKTEIKNFLFKIKFIIHIYFEFLII